MTTKEAETLVRRTLGPLAVVAEWDGEFLVGEMQLLTRLQPGETPVVVPGHGMREILGRGNSWEAAIVAAGVRV